jgi:chemotaxis signal transduction protein
MSSENVEALGIIVFKVAEQEFCFDIRLLNGILKPRELDVVRVDGIEEPAKISFDGEIYTIIDLASLFSGREPTNNDGIRFLLVDYMGQRLALRVEVVTQIITGLVGKESSLKFVGSESTPLHVAYFENESQKLWQLDFEKCIELSTLS